MFSARFFATTLGRLPQFVRPGGGLAAVRQCRPGRMPAETEHQRVCPVSHRSASDPQMLHHFVKGETRRFRTQTASSSSRCHSSGMKSLQVAAPRETTPQIFGQSAKRTTLLAIPLRSGWLKCPILAINTRGLRASWSLKILKIRYLRACLKAGHRPPTRRLGYRVGAIPLSPNNLRTLPHRRSHLRLFQDGAHRPRSNTRCSLSEDLSRPQATRHEHFESTFCLRGSAIALRSGEWLTDPDRQFWCGYHITGRAPGKIQQQAKLRENLRLSLPRADEPQRYCQCLVTPILEDEQAHRPRQTNTVVP